jgi:hypothetical protein
MHMARLRVIFLALFAAVVATLVVLAPANANPSKPYSIVICGGGQIGCSSANPAVIAPGGTTTNPSALSVTFTNDNKLGSGIQLGSDNLNVPSTPAGFSVISTGLPQCPPTFNNSAPACVILSNGGTSVGFRNLNLMPGQSTTITLSAVTPAPSTTACTTASPCLWTDHAKQSNDFSGTGNDLSSDGNSSYGTVTSSVSSCPKNKPCNTTLGNGGTSTGAPGSISTTITTSSGKAAGTQLESLDFGGPLDASKCSGVSELHLTYENLSNGAGRSQTITITTTDYSATADHPGYQAEGCFETAQLFTMKVIDPTTKAVSLAPANPTTLPDGTPGFQGLLPDCGTQALQVNCSKNPGVSLRQTSADGTVHTLVVIVPPGFDARIGN